MDTKIQVLRSKKGLQLLDDVSSIWVEERRARTGWMCSKEGKKCAKGTMVHCHFGGAPSLRCKCLFLGNTEITVERKNPFRIFVYRFTVSKRVLQKQK